jgi:O-methyltransferase
MMVARLLELDSPRLVRAFDTFAGMPVSGPLDTHLVGAFEVAAGKTEALLVPLGVRIHSGVMPDTFVGLEGSAISVAHIDVDQYDSVRDCLAFIYPRLQSGGVVVIDDYNCHGCPGAKQAVDEFMVGKPETLRETPQTPQVWFQKA